MTPEGTYLPPDHCPRPRHAPISPHDDDDDDDDDLWQPSIFMSTSRRFQPEELYTLASRRCNGGRLHLSHFS